MPKKIIVGIFLHLCLFCQFCFLFFFGFPFFLDFLFSFFLVIFSFELFLSFCHSLFWLRMCWLRFLYLIILIFIFGNFWWNFFTLLFHYFSISWWLFKYFKRSQSIVLIYNIIFFFLTLMLKLQCLNCHLFQLFIHSSCFEWHVTFWTFPRSRYTCSFPIFLDAFLAEDNITLITLKWLNRNIEADHTIESFKHFTKIIGIGHIFRAQFNFWLWNIFHEIFHNLVLDLSIQWWNLMCWVEWGVLCVWTW